jgi:hypothetical protein
MGGLFAKARTPSRRTGLSRRGFLTAAGVAGSAAAFTAITARPALASTRTRPLARPRGRDQALPGAGLVGATVSTALYPLATDRVAAANMFDGFVQLPAATVVQKWFFNEDEWPTTVNPDISGLAALGCKFLMCFAPSRKLTHSNQEKLKNTCELFMSNGINFDVVLWQEPNDMSHKFFATGEEYVAYHEYYRPYVPAGLKVVYCAAGCFPTFQQDFYPGDDQVDMVYCDLYASGWIKGFNFDTIIGIADGASTPKPFGIGEFGRSAHRKNEPTPAQYTGYVNYLVDTMSGRLNQGQVNADVIYFDGVNTTTPWNIITSPTDWKVSRFQTVYDALSSAGLPGG